MEKMKKAYKTTDGGIITKIGRLKKIFFNNQGSPYFMWNNRKQFFDEIPALTYPVMYEDKNGKIGNIGGYIPLCNWGGVLVEIVNDGEAVQLWNDIQI